MLASIARAKSRAAVVACGVLLGLIGLGRRRGRAAADDRASRVRQAVEGQRLINDPRFLLSLIAVLLVAPSPLHAADDTFACLLQSGPKITIWRDFGYTPYKNRSFADKTKFDLQRSTWKQEQVPDYKNPYPINIGGGKNGCWAGGTVLGTSDLNASWGQLYKRINPDDPDSGRQNSAAIVWTAAPNMTVDGIRVHNAWDSIRPAIQIAKFYGEKRLGVPESR